MSVDEKTAKGLVETLKDGQKGFAASADKLADSTVPQWADTMRRLQLQRVQFAQEIVAFGHDGGVDVDESGSALAAAHRGWLTLKDALTGDKPSGVLDAAVQGEDHTVSEYEKALKEDLSEGFRAMVQRQHDEIVAARAEVKGLQALS
ncbi:PA2169 family four-helix-bundle protein [Lapillicoccus sp.]|uniref:PA2169 family four-helix-bundle protein n=1 Tax=Lapillicoccus sp. TaxID=1909287 RepID=UPI0025CE3CF7|nr:PA2169 family four-helix-bundle protein [Lapillicoccus sp.]